MRRFISLAILLIYLFLAVPVNAQFGGTQIVFDPQMLARQLTQLQQETQAVLTEAQQLTYMIQNTNGGYGGAWQSDQSLLNELGGLIQQQGGLSYTLGNLQGQFQRQFPGYVVPSNAEPTELNQHRRDTGHAQRHACRRPSSGAKLCERAGSVCRARSEEHGPRRGTCRRFRSGTKSLYSRRSRFSCSGSWSSQ